MNRIFWVINVNGIYFLVTPLHRGFSTKSKKPTMVHRGIDLHLAKGMATKARSHECFNVIFGFFAPLPEKFWSQTKQSLNAEFPDFNCRTPL